MSIASNKSAKPSKYPNTPEQMMWISQTRQGNAAAFGKIVEKYQRPVYNLCYQMLSNATEAEDAAQEVFLRAYARLDSYDDRRQFSTWLFSIASNYCIDRLRRVRPTLISWDDFKVSWLDNDNTQPEQALLKAEATEEVQTLLKSLNPDDRLVIILKYWYTLSYQEMSQTLGTTVSAIKSKLFRARRQLAQTATQQQNATTTANRIAPAIGY